MREPLILPLAAIAAGICLSQLYPFLPRETLVAAISLFLLALAALRWARAWCVRTSLFSAFVALGILADTANKPGPPPEIDASSQEIVTISGCVVEPPVLTADREHFVLELEPGARARVSLVLREDEPPPDLRYGQKVDIEAKIRRPRNFGNPGAFDYVRYLSRQNVYWTASVRSAESITRLTGECGSRAQGYIYGLRQAAIERIERLYAGNAYAIGMMEAILIGESGKLEKVWTDHFRRTGTYHALVISGLHVTVLAGVLLFLLRLCMLNELAALAVAAVAAWVYAAVSGWSAPVIRAAGGFTLYLVGRYFFRRGRVLNLLAAVGIAYLLYDPGQLFDASFQLSFFSVAAIGALAIPLLEATSGKLSRAPLEIHDVGRDPRMAPRAAALRVELRLLAETVELWTPLKRAHALSVLALVTRVALWVWEMGVVSATVQVALALPMALYFHRISVTGITANLVIVPLLSAVVPVGFAAIFTGLAPLAWAALAMLRWSEAVANFHIRFEPSMRIPDPPAWLGWALVAMLGLTALAMRLKSRWQWPSGVVAVGLFAVLFACPFAPELAPRTLELTMIDVGQGDSLFVSLPDGRAMLVDAGGIPSYGRKTKPRMDIGEDVVSPYLWTRRIRKVDIIAITHAHEDHIGGLGALLENFRPRELWTGAVPDDERWRGIEAHARSLGVRVVHRHAGEQSGNIQILAPSAEYLPGATAKNNDSLAMRITYGEHSFLLMGDMEKQAEYELLASNLLSRSTVLKVAHHGSRTSSTEDFLAATEPALALISAGWENSFHHPHPDVLERLAGHHVEVLRTDAEGLVTVRTDGRRLSIIRAAHEASRTAQPAEPW